MIGGDICGLYGLPSPVDLERSIRRMSETIAHHGPDGEGTFIGDGVALGHCRLSIIDMSSTGAQPMTHGAATVVYNGEACNFPQLRANLRASATCSAVIRTPKCCCMPTRLGDSRG
jgi:asparagine synthase (glutamine-hydrolysing)